MELFITSQASKVLEDIVTRLQRAPSEYVVAFIPTAANLYADAWWAREDREKLVELGFKVIDVDIAGKSEEQLGEMLKGTDIIFVAGGNTFYLLEQVKESGLDKLLPGLLEKGVIYIGSSAGSVILAPDIEPSKFFDEREKSNLKTTDALGLINFVPIPHMGGITDALNKKVFSEYKNWKFKLEPMTDQQYIHVKDGKRVVRTIE